MSAQERNEAVVQANTKQLEVPTFNKKEIEKIAREALSTFIDLTPFGKFSLAEETDWNSVEHPEIVPLVKNLFEKYDPNKITIVKLNATIPNEESQSIEVTASDTAVHITSDDYEVIQVLAANHYKIGDENEGVFPDISFSKLNNEGTIIYGLSVVFYGVE